MRGFFIMGFLLSLPLALAGCSSDTAKAIDGKVSEYMGMPCSANNLAAGESYCSHPAPDLVQEPLFCYKSLGNVDCYARPNPYDTEQSVRVRQVLALEDRGAAIMSIEEYELRQIMKSSPVKTE